MRAVVVAVFLVGCYAPSAPSGAYQCASDGSCPSSQSCVCGLCVTNAADAVCKVVVDVGSSPTVLEHQTFPLTVTAQNGSGGKAAGYDGSVALSFELPDGSVWADVSPATVKLTAGTVTTMVSVNRETVPPQSPRVVVRLLGQRYESGDISVLAPPFVRDATPIVAPLGLTDSYGWSKHLVGLPSVRKIGTAWTMYFSGLDSQQHLSVGLADSTDGKTFVPTAAPLLEGSAGRLLSTPTVYDAPDGVAMFVSDTVSDDLQGGAISIDRSVSSDGRSGFSVPQTQIDCKSGPDFCKAKAGFPMVLPDPTLVGTDGKANGWLMYFIGATAGNVVTAVPPIAAMGLASSVDGKNFVVSPSPVLNGDLGGEATLLSPQVYVEGSVYKMWYSFSRSRDGTSTRCKTSIGYATSTDGRYWVRSPSNTPTAPIEGPSGSGWDAADVGFLAGSVVPATDGSLALYYTVYRADVSGCIPNGIGRAVRP